MKILVTGALGFIGFHIVNQLLSDGHTVVGVDNFDSLLYQGDFKSNRLSQLNRLDNFTFRQIDLFKDEFESYLIDVDAVINEAGLPGQLLSWSEMQRYTESNFLVVSKLIRAIKSQKRNIRLIQASTSSVYGKTAWGNEDQAKNPCSPYGVTKLAAENLLHAYGQNADFPFVILRYFSVYGPHQRPDMAISRFLNKIKDGDFISVFGDGSQVRDCTYVGDIARGTIAAMKQGTPGATYNLSSSNPCTLKDIINSCFEVSGKEVDLKFETRTLGDQDRTFGDCSRAMAEIGYKPQTTLLDGLRKQWDYVNGIDPR